MAEKVGKRSQSGNKNPAKKLKAGEEVLVERVYLRKVSEEGMYTNLET